ncbi:4'-phosphopantetheinyl transferase family protein [Paucibacter sp. XJ19-41]|uniref:4'-phosphopantetheinyl transferase family protein n=1 Tax=Paucibacter sp. XJ19-41 TaxID=2927824 RepID=UPI0023498B23|nr:4'-phosphopantetheinyl transferase superfamily protein [Paucibacter sp. XJ19-41]MDC6169388.1 4'-phosphopantetheinyl transferase superfamily protein [Paucibacter sp. XJ19-41]
MQAWPLPEDVPAGLELWCLPLDLAVEPTEGLRLLTSEERARAARLRMRADRVRFVATRGALRRLLGARLGCDPLQLPLVTGRQGKPGLPESWPQPPVFNVSHAGGFALMALAPAGVIDRLGVDIEHCDRGVDTREIEASVLTLQERQGLALDRRPDAFFHYWVGKEAALKALGIGLAAHLPGLSVQPTPEGRVTVSHALQGWPAVSACALQAPTGYAAALAWCHSHFQQEIPS